jgi:hypothetical protein
MFVKLYRISFLRPQPIAFQQKISDMHHTPQLHICHPHLLSDLGNCPQEMLTNQLTVEE